MSTAAPDGELIKACADFEANGLAIRDIYDNPARTLSDEEAAAAAAPLEAKSAALLDRLDTLRASTSAGVHARARTLHAHDSVVGFDWAAPGSVSNRLLMGLLRDAMAVPVEPGT